VSDVVTTLVGSGVISAGIATLGGMWAARRPPRKLQDADYAKIATQMSREIADDLREDNRELEKKVDRLAVRVGQLTDALWIAIRRIESSGQDATDMRAVIINGHPLD
jgi:translation initiation factor 2B subunit (eIF-2B alpha/beta/delta family)